MQKPQRDQVTHSQSTLSISNFLQYYLEYCINNESNNWNSSNSQAMIHMKILIIIEKYHAH